MLYDPVKKKAFCEYCFKVMPFEGPDPDPDVPIDPEEAGYRYEKENIVSAQRVRKQSELADQRAIAMEEIAEKTTATRKNIGFVREWFYVIGIIVLLIVIIVLAVLGLN